MREMNLKSKREFARRARNQDGAQTQWRCPVPAYHGDSTPTPQGTPPLSLGVNVQSSAFKVQSSKFDARDSHYLGVNVQSSAFKVQCSMFGPQGSRHPGARGYTLIEMIGVVAVLVILGLALAPVIIRRVDRAARTKEVNDMAAISNALVL